jgi:hypothetical protein
MNRKCAVSIFAALTIALATTSVAQSDIKIRDQDRKGAQSRRIEFRPGLDESRSARPESR